MQRILCLLLSTSALPLLSAESEIRFAYIQESPVAAADELELEVSTTYYRGRQQFYRRLDNTLEIEYGLTERLQSALYINYSSVTVDNGSGQLQTETQLKGVSAELKYLLTNRDENLFGTTLYGEVGTGSEESEFETKFIIDTKIDDDVIIAYNAVYELEIEEEINEIDYAHVFENQFGVSFEIVEEMSLGIEARTSHKKSEHSPTRGALYVGPNIACEIKRLAFVLCAQWQVTALGTSSPGTDLELNDHERFQMRLLVSYEF